jgi:uncharacterized protein YggE
MIPRMRTVLPLILMTLVAAPVAAQQPAEPPQSVVVTSGEGIVKRTPDRAWVTIASEARAKTPQEAQKQNATVMSAVLDRLKGAGISAEAIKTAAIDLQPEFDYANNRQTLRGYVARNTIEVRVDTLPKLGEIIDASVGSGATTIGGVRFDIQDRSGAEREAIKMAVADARQRAEAAATGANMKIDRIVRIEEHRAQIMEPRPMMAMRAGMAQEAATTPVAPGELQIRAGVTLTVTIR